jgi:competence protein ComGC
MRYPIRKSEAFTAVELIVVIGVVFLVLLVTWPYLGRNHQRYTTTDRISCVENLLQIGTAYQIWAADHNGHFPASESTTNEGWRELLTNADQGSRCWTNYAIMSNELGQSARLVVCPSDERQRATNFSSDFSNTKLSYFVGVSANSNQPQSLLAGDRNLGPGIKPDPGYGFSPESGQGNDVAIQTNSQAGPVSWSLKMHSAGNTAGAGNILLGDSSVQQVTSGAFRKSWQPNFTPTTNWPVGHAPLAPSIRVLFP